MIIIDSLIRRRLKAIMVELLKQILPDINDLVDRIGTKALIACGGIAALYYMATIDKLEGLHAAIGIAVIAVAFFVFRARQESEQSLTGCPGCQNDKEDADETD